MSRRSVFLAVVAVAAAGPVSGDLRAQPERSISAGPAESLRFRSSVERRITQLLASQGFSNVAAVVEGSRLIVTYENARYRDERRALSEAVGLLRPELSADEELVLVPSTASVPLASIYLSLNTPLRASLDVSNLPASLAHAPRSNTSFGRVDVIVHPWFEAIFGDYDNPVASRTGVAPEIRVAIRRGLTLSAQALLTLQDDVPTGESTVRPAVVTINQLVRLPRNVLVSATAGTFTRDRYGVDVEARAFAANGIWSVGTELGRTGVIGYSRDGWWRSPMSATTALVDVAWRVPRYGVTIRSTAGAFLDDEKGVRLDMVRQFGEFEVGGFGMYSAHGTNGGVTLRIPVPPRQYSKLAHVRVRAAEAFRWQYQYSLAPAGWRYHTGNGLEELGRRFSPFRLSDSR